MGHRDDDIGTPALPPHALFLFRRPVAGFRALGHPRAAVERDGLGVEVNMLSKLAWHERVQRQIRPRPILRPGEGGCRASNSPGVIRVPSGWSWRVAAAP